MKEVTFEEFFKMLLKRKEFAEAFNQITSQERECVKEFCERFFRHYKISKRGLLTEYINKICDIVGNNNLAGSIGILERAIYEAGGYLPRKKYNDLQKKSGKV